MKNLFLAILALFVVVSCSTIGSITKSAKQPSLDGTSWQLANNVEGTTPTLLVESGKISGNAGCNNYFGSVSMNVQGGMFIPSGLGSTRKACANMQTETSFMSTLSAANRYVVSGSTLELYKDNLLLLKFNRK